MQNMSWNLELTLEVTNPTDNVAERWKREFSTATFPRVNNALSRHSNIAAAVETIAPSCREWLEKRQERWAAEGHSSVRVMRANLVFYNKPDARGQKVGEINLLTGKYRKLG